jgi:hypothetical protein
MPISEVRFVGSHASGDVFRDLLFEVKLEFVVETLRDSGTEK